MLPKLGSPKFLIFFFVFPVLPSGKDCQAQRLLGYFLLAAPWSIEGAEDWGKGGGKQKLIRDITRPGKHTKSY
jgi:hypothetical protein